MTPERRAPEGDAASEGSSGLTPSLTQTVDVRLRHRTGPLCGCPLDHHECGVDEPIRGPACAGRCQTADIPTLRYWGERHGCCPCLVERAS